MNFSKQYRIFDEGTEIILLSETTVMGIWSLQVEFSTLNTLAEISSNILCNVYPELKEEKIDKLILFIKIGENTETFVWEKGSSKQRILEEFAKLNWVS